MFCTVVYYAHRVVHSSHFSQGPSAYIMYICSGNTVNDVIILPYTDVLPAPSGLTVTEQSPQCVEVKLQPPENTLCIDNYTIKVVPGGDTVREMVVTTDELVLNICDLNLCVNNYTFRASSNGFGLPPAEINEMTATLSSELFIFVKHGLMWNYFFTECELM